MALICVELTKLFEQSTLFKNTLAPVLNPDPVTRTKPPLELTAVSPDKTVLNVASVIATLDINTPNDPPPATLVAVAGAIVI